MEEKQPHKARHPPSPSSAEEGREGGCTNGTGTFLLDSEARAAAILACRLWEEEDEQQQPRGANEETETERREHRWATLAFVAPLLAPSSSSQQQQHHNFLLRVWIAQFEAALRHLRNGDGTNGDVGGRQLSTEQAVEIAGRLVAFAMMWASTYPDDFVNAEELVQRMAQLVQEWREVMTSLMTSFSTNVLRRSPNKNDTGADNGATQSMSSRAAKHVALARRLLLHIEAVRSPGSAFGRQDKGSLLLRAGSPRKAAGQAASTRRRSLRLLVGDTPNLVKREGSSESLPSLDTPRPSSNSSAGASADLDFMAFDAATIARELTLIEFDLFCNIRPRELLNQAWQKKDKERLAPNISLLISRFNEVAYWIATEILQTQGSQMQSVVIKKFVDVANHCYEMGNFNTLMEIISGLSHSSVKRLKAQPFVHLTRMISTLTPISFTKTAWKSLDDRHQRKFEELEQLMSPRSNFVDYREVLKKRTLEQSERERERTNRKNSKIVSVSPVLPYFALLLRDLTFINEGNQKYITRDDIPDEKEEVEREGQTDFNWDLMVMLNQMRLIVQQYQRFPYAFVSNNELRRVLTNLRHIDDENELWNLSQLAFSSTFEVKKAHRRSLSAPLKKIEALIHDNKQRGKDDKSRARKESVLSDQESNESLEFSVCTAEEEWERDASGIRATRTRANADAEQETPSRRKRRIAQSKEDSVPGTKRRWEEGKKKAESMWDQFLNRYFGSHIPTNRENTDSWRFYQSLSIGMEDVARTPRSQASGQPLERSGLTIGMKLTPQEKSAKSFKEVAEEAKKHAEDAHEEDNGDSTSRQRGGSGDFFQQLSGGAKEMMQKTNQAAHQEPKQQQQRNRAHSEATHAVKEESSQHIPRSRSDQSGRRRRDREGSFLLFENLGGGALAMLSRDVLPVPLSSSANDVPTSPRRAAGSSPSSSSGDLRTLGRSHPTASVSTTTSEFLSTHHCLEGGAD